MPLSARASLRWIGFSREGLVATCDSHQQLRVLSGLAPQRSPLQFCQMEWVLLMSLRRAMKEKQSLLDARIPSNSIPCRTLLLDRRSFPKDRQRRRSSRHRHFSAHDAASLPHRSRRPAPALRIPRFSDPIHRGETAPISRSRTIFSSSPTSWRLFIILCAKLMGSRREPLRGKPTRSARCRSSIRCCCAS